MKRITFFVSMKIESDLRSFEKNNIIERASCKTQNEVLTFQIWLSFCFYSKIACNCWTEVLKQLHISFPFPQDRETKNVTQVRK